MITVTKSTRPTTNDIIVIGRQAETEVRQIEFDLSYLIETYGEGTGQLVHQRSQDVAPYIVSDTVQSGDTFTWTVSNTDTIYDGYGQAELRWTVNDALAKTVIYRTKTVKSITGDIVIPAALQSWYDAMIEYIDDNSVSPEDLADAIAEYISEHPIEAPVTSVNEQTGDVVLDAEDVGALPSDTSFVSSFNGSTGAVTYTAPVTSVNGSTGAVTVTVPTKTSDLQNDSGFLTSAPVTSVNSKTGAVTLSASDVGAGTYSKPSGGIPKTDLASAVQTSLGKADSALQSAPVTSVNSKTGAVTLTASDVGAGTYSKPSGGIPASDLASAVQTSLGKADTALQSAPVSSVNTKTGAVVLSAGDLSYDGTETYSSGTVGKEITDVKSDLSDKLDAPSTAGTSGQVLTSDGQGGQSWQTPQSGGSVSPYTSNPSALGTASAGSSNDYSRGDHVHPMPSAANVGAIASPSSPSSGDFLVYNGSAWVAQSLSTWQGGSY